MHWKYFKIKSSFEFVENGTFYIIFLILIFLFIEYTQIMKYIILKTILRISTRISYTCKIRPFKQYFKTNMDYWLYTFDKVLFDDLKFSEFFFSIL